ncbi:MAG: hypothetical protein M0Z61_18095 [Nitrospiraceae bacterium]|nr:hypothetical protein [Nitrospiraceae bacterium]
MKKALAVIATLVFVLSIMSMAFAASTTMQGTIKAVNEKTGTITFCPTGSSTDKVLKVGKSVNIKNLKTGKTAVTVDNGVVTGAKATPQRRMIEGC